MWTKKHSVILSLVVTRIFMALCVVVAVGTPIVASHGGFYHVGGIMAGKEQMIPIIIYACLVPAVILLIFLDSMLRNIKNDLVFVAQNVRSLRIISWTCFAVAIITLVSGIFVALPLLAIFAAAGFVGLIIRVVKNVIAAAVELKTENDFTI